MDQRPLNERVKDHVKRAGLTHADLAKLTGWDEQRVDRVLNGRTRLLAEDMEAIARALGKPVAAFFRGRRAS